MPTLARYHQLRGDVYYHIYNRGNRKYTIFHDDEDNYRFKKIVKRYVDDGKIKIYHYIIMSNHYHLEAEIMCPEEMASTVGGINRAYTHYYHKKYKTAGYLWQGRFGAKPIESEMYSLACGGYIEMNAVRKGLVSSPEDYKYSSSRYYILGDSDEIVTEDPNYVNFGNDTQSRQRNYLSFLLEKYKGDENMMRFFDQKILGGTEFKSKLCKRSGRWVPRRKGTPGFVS